MLVLLLACALPPSADAPSENGACPIDTCVAGTTGVDGAVACCVSRHGYGLDGDALASLEATCADAACDPGAYLSAEAALCVAQAYGLDPGLAECHAWFEYDPAGDATWMLLNETSECPPEANLCGGGDFVQIDARSGAYRSGGWQGS